jgi:hypothetical protein
LRAATFQFAFAQAQMAAKIQFEGNAMQRILVDQIGAQTRQTAFRLVGKTLVEHQTDDAVEHAIAEKFEPLVVARAEAAMRQRLME